MKQETPDGKPFLIEGNLTNLHWERGSENLLAKVSAHYKRNAIVTGPGAAVGEMFGQVANAAMLAMYDGEDTQNFMCLIDNQVACGQFGGAEQLPEGGNLKAVVSRKDGVLYVHAVMDEARGLVWISHPWGTRAEMWANLKLALFVFLIANTSFAVSWLVSGKGSFWDTMQYALIGGGALSLIMAIWSMKDMKAIAGPSTEYFRMLGIADPEGVNLNGYSYHAVVGAEYHARGEKPPQAWFGESEYHYRNLFSLRKAIADGKLKMAVPERDET